MFSLSQDGAWLGRSQPRRGDQSERQDEERQAGPDRAGFQFLELVASASRA
ncbi:hypothetical protein SynBIOSE41_03487 [Synechococcus sp. BIOS-E4-1]|nr:hypothetical protein SynBIOSE41_03487 [Synechococcus sp. BIOS-E4-1]